MNNPKPSWTNYGASFPALLATRGFAVIALLASVASAWAATNDIEFQVDSTVNLPRTQTNIKVGFTDPNSAGKEGERAWILKPVLQAGSPVMEAKAWIVEAAKGDDKQYPEFTIEQVPRQGDPYMLILVLKKPFDKERTYTVRLAKGYNLQACILPEWHLVRPEKFEGLTIEKTHIEEDLGFIGRNKALEKNFSVKTGDNNTASLKLTYGFDNWQKDHWAGGAPWHVQAMLDAAGTYKPSQSYKYIDNMKVEADGAYTLPTINNGPFGFEALSEIGASGRMESDQYFKDIDGSVGVTWWNAINGDFLQQIGNLLCFVGDLPDRGSVPSLVLNVAYDGVFKMHDDLPGQGSSHDTTDRIRASVYWSVLLAHKTQLLTIIGKDTAYDAHLVIDATIAYDFVSKQALPTEKLSLEVSPVLKTGKEPSVVVTYENGKTRATFQNYSAILAGVKLPF